MMDEHAQFQEASETLLIFFFTIVQNSHTYIKKL